MIPVRPCAHSVCLRDGMWSDDYNCRYPITPEKMAAVRRDHMRRGATTQMLRWAAKGLRPRVWNGVKGASHG